MSKFKDIPVQIVRKGDTKDQNYINNSFPEEVGFDMFI